jgi:phosphoribosylanthranilate isomerase
MALTRIKICGMTRPEDARAATDCGADAIGMVFYAGSARAVTGDQAVGIAAVVPPFVTKVALFVNEPAVSIRRILDNVPVDLIQFHGEESADFCQQFGRPWMKALRVKPGLDIAGECARFPLARAVLLDAWQQGEPGGTGKTFDWGLAPQDLSLPLVLAGGLDESNVGEAISALHPAAVDVCSGVERSPGIKDARKIRQFIEAVRAADLEMEGSTYDD